tara:strand:- start:2574 stop:2726 length:153 start_codon:yes stop_codon:yes gene_type:complete
MFKILSELFSFAINRKKYWLIPVMICTILIGGLMILSKGSAVAPFIYAIF